VLVTTHFMDEDVAKAEARLREARALRDAAAGSRLPRVEAKASASEQQLSTNGQLPLAQIPGFDPRFSLFEAGFDASWEIDLWGGTRRSLEAATARAAAAEARHRDVLLQVVAQVVRTYAELRGGQAALAALRADAAAQSAIATLVRHRFQAGDAARTDDARAQAQARSSAASIPGEEAEVRAAAYRLALLTARPPEALADLAARPAPLPSTPTGFAAGLRSDLLRRRPDVRAAEAELAAATADVGVQMAQLFPSVSLLGSFTQQSRAVGELASGGSTQFSIGPSLRWPIFSAGRIRAQVRAADARADAAAARYEKAVLGALADSETALNRYAAAIATLAERQQARDDSATALDLVRQRYRSGEDDRLAVLQAQSALASADAAATDARRRTLEAFAALIKALGGGWAEAPGQANG